MRSTGSQRQWYGCRLLLHFFKASKNNFSSYIAEVWNFVHIWSLFIGMCLQDVSTKSSLHTCHELHSCTLNLVPSKTIWCSSSGLCFLYVHKECLSLESHSEDSLCRRPAERVISPLRCFVRELLIGSRDILHPPTPNTPTNLCPIRNDPHMDAPLSWHSQWKAMGSQPWCCV